MNKTINCQLCTVLNIVLLFIILILIARTVLFPQSLVYNAHLNQANEMKKLIEETSKLLKVGMANAKISYHIHLCVIWKDLSSANVALPESVKSDIKLIQEDLSQVCLTIPSPHCRTRLYRIDNIEFIPLSRGMTLIQESLVKSHLARHRLQVLHSCCCRLLVLGHLLHVITRIQTTQSDSVITLHFSY